MADSWPGSSYSYRDMGSFCHHVFKQNVIPAITLSFLASLSLPYKVQWQIVLLLHASRQFMRLCFFFLRFFFPHVLHPLPDCSTHHSQLCFCAALRGGASQLFLVLECVREVLWAGDRPIHFAFVHQHLLYWRGSTCFRAAQGPFLDPCEEFQSLQQNYVLYAGPLLKHTIYYW